jgi:putative ABC transport system ATP-binding protein
MSSNTTVIGEVMVGFLIDKLDRAGNKKFEQDLQKTLKKSLKWKRPSPTVGEFNTFMIGTGRCEYRNFAEPQNRIAAEKAIQILYRKYVARSLNLLQSRMKRNRSEIEAHKILAKFLETIPDCPANPKSVISAKNREMVNCIEKTITMIVDQSTIIFWSFNGVGDERIVLSENIYQRQQKEHSILHAFDELLILNFAHQFLRSLKELARDVCTHVDQIHGSLPGSAEVTILDPELASEVFKILIGDLVGGVDSFRTMIRQINRIEEISISSRDEITLLSEFGEDFAARLMNGQYSRELKAELQQNLEILQHLQTVLRKLEKQALTGKIQVNLAGLQQAILELPIQLRKIKQFSDRFMDIAFLAPEAGGIAIETNQDEFAHEHEEDTIVEAIGLHKTYRPSQSTVYALRGANLKIKQGEFVAILGPSGTGKTTLINLMAGLDVPDRGKVFLNGKDISTMSDNELSEFRRKHIGFVFQQYVLDPRLTVQENVELPALMAGKTEQLNQRVQEILENVGIGEYADQIPTKLSGGQMQRVIIARACINNPLVVFADEPTGDLDSDTGKQVMANFRQLCNEKGIAIVVVTHDHEMAEFADRVIHMADGQIIV